MLNKSIHRFITAEISSEINGQLIHAMTELGAVRRAGIPFSDPAEGMLSKASLSPSEG